MCCVVFYLESCKAGGREANFPTKIALSTVMHHGKRHIHGEGTTKATIHPKSKKQKRRVNYILSEIQNIIEQKGLLDSILSSNKVTAFK